MGEAKIRLSKTEQEMMLDTAFILTKRTVIRKIIGLLGELQAAQQAWLSQHFPELAGCSPKISKGENYRGLPYVVLDYPSRFDKENILAIRTMFWWGNFFSVTLQLAGKYQSEYVSRIIQQYDLLVKNDFAACINQDQWQHEFSADNYRPVSDLQPLELQKMVEERGFVKIAKKFDLDDWDELPVRIMEAHRLLIRILIPEAVK